MLACCPGATECTVGDQPQSFFYTPLTPGRAAIREAAGKGVDESQVEGTLRRLALARLRRLLDSSHRDEGAVRSELQWLRLGIASGLLTQPRFEAPPPLLSHERGHASLSRAIDDALHVAAYCGVSPRALFGLLDEHLASLEIDGPDEVERTREWAR